jgi:mono/diheme cytochrome c family protein
MLENLQRRLALLPYLALIGSCLVASTQAESSDEFFETKVRPILAEHCFSCHSEKVAKVGLKFDSADGFRTDDGQGSVIVNGDADASRLIKAIRHDDSVSAMPPEGKLSDSEIASLADWINAGANWPANTITLQDPSKQLWSLQPLRRHKPPTGLPIERLMSVDDIDRWSESFVDRWILAGLSAIKVTPSQPASMQTLARRLANDLTGLPPSDELLERLAEYPDDPEAFSDVIDELLDSDDFGVHWGRHWLDVARYGDTTGEVFDEGDINPHAYTYRDWVVRAFNDDMPYDEFIENQLIADKLHGPNSPELAALGFLTVGLKFEGNEPDIIDDRLDVVFRGLQGLSIGCARCHDHKYDPISTHDYYSLYSIFAEATEDNTPLFSNDEDRKTYAAFKVKLNSHIKIFQDFSDQQHKERFGLPFQDVAKYLLTATMELDASRPESITLDDKGKRSDGLHQTIVDKYREVIQTAKLEHDSIFAPWIAFIELSVDSSSNNFSGLAKRFQTPTDDAAYKEQEESGDIHPQVRKFFDENPPSSRQELAKRYAELFQQTAKRWIELRDAAYDTSGDVPAALPELIEGDRSNEVWELMFSEYPRLDIGEEGLKNLLEGEVQEKFEELKNAIGEFENSDQSPPQAMIFVDGGEREQYVFIRGKEDQAGDLVEPHFLSAIEPDHESYDYETAREQLCESIIDPLNPLTARVWVNRVWMHLFGTGLVATPSDFGIRGESPSHAELLDALAIDFMRNGWSTKELIRKLVSTATYQQSSFDREDAIAVDPENRWLWRMNRKRMTSESLRDSILAATGSLDKSIGGRPIDSLDESDSNRRTIYFAVKRRYASDLSRAFDFANPSMHTPSRHETIVPQQALWLWNGSFVGQQSAQFDEADFANRPTDEAIDDVYWMILRREPGDDERSIVSEAIDQWKNKPAAPKIDRKSAWRYGLARFSKDKASIEDFEEFTETEEDVWVGESGMKLYGSGGNPGTDNKVVLVRRWIVPVNGTISIDGNVSNYSEDHPESDGVAIAIIHNQSRLKKLTVKQTEIPVQVEGLSVKAGDTIDFAIHGRKHREGDDFEWTCAIKFTDESLGERWNTDSDSDYRTEDAELYDPLGPFGRLAQVLWMSNEFIYVD